MSQDPPVQLWKTTPCWGLSSTSPFCVKLETWMRLAKVPYESRVVMGPPKSSNGKVPWVEFSDGSHVADSGVIIATLAQRFDCSLDDGLDAGQQAIATTITRTLEDHFYWALIWDRWVIPEHFAMVRREYFGMLRWPLPLIAPPLLRRSLLRSLHGQGFGRMSDQEIMDRAERDLQAVSDLLGDREFFFDRPTSIDATVHAFVRCATCPPYDGPIQTLTRRFTRLEALCDRVDALVWASDAADG